jgi:hypothetical protein
VTRLLSASLVALALPVVGAVAPAQAVVKGVVVPGGWMSDQLPTRNEFAFVGRYTTDNGVCTASLITPNTAITTKHCVRKGGRIAFGMLNHKRDSTRAEQRTVVDSVSFGDVIASPLTVVSLDRPIFTIQPIPLVRQSDKAAVQAGRHVEVAGWGYINDVIEGPGVQIGKAIPSAELRKATLKIRGSDSGYLDMTSVAGHPAHGDSGGPVLSRDPQGKRVLIGTMDIAYNFVGHYYANRTWPRKDLIDWADANLAYWRAHPPAGPPATGGSVPTPRPGNKLPAAAFSYGRLSGTGNVVALDGRGSTDPDGVIRSWQWSIGGRTIATGAAPTVRLGIGTAPSVTLKVTDSGGATAEVTRTLSLPNRAPSITTPSPADGAVVGSNQPTLSAAASDPDGDVLTYAYRITGPAVDRSSGPVTGRWTVPARTLDPGGTYTWTVTVTDPSGARAQATRQLTVAMLPVAADVIPTPSGKGYWQVASDGGVFAYGDAQFHGSVPGPGLRLTNIMGMARTPSGKGYWLVGRDGGVFSFGDAPFHGSLPGLDVRVGNIVGMVPTKSGGGYWLVGSDGGVFSFGDAQFHGSLGGRPLNAPVEAIAATRSGGGYWLVARDGGVFAFGDAPFHGSMGGRPLQAPIVDMDVTPDGGGYWMTAEDGGVFSFGNAPFHGSMAGQPLNGHVTGMSATPSGKGYWLNGCDGGLFTFGDAPFLGANATYQCRGVG